MLGPRPAAVARELTKMFETVRRGTLAELAAGYGAESAPKGEIVVLIAPRGEAERAEDAAAGLDGRIAAALAQHSLKDAAAVVAGETGLPRREVYARALQLARQEPGGNEPGG